LATIKDMDNSLLYNTILKRIQDEDSDLTSLTGKGSFYSPELYVAFIIGKEIKRNEFAIFGQETKWLRETDFKNGGPTDFAFETDRGTYAFELKLRNTSQSYCSDIEKLKRLDNHYSKFFVALVDSWESEKELDNRILSIENKYDKELQRVNSFKSFPTMQDRYKGQICCTLGLWKL
jgi:hypothetical protein